MAATAAGGGLGAAAASVSPTPAVRAKRRDRALRLPTLIDNSHSQSLPKQRGKAQSGKSFRVGLAGERRTDRPMILRKGRTGRAGGQWPPERGRDVASDGRGSQ